MGESKYRSNKISYIFALAAVVGFAVFFAYNLYDSFLYWCDGRQAQRNSEIVQNIFAEHINEIAEFIAAGQEGSLPDFNEGSYLLARTRQATGSANIVAYIAIPGTNIGNAIVQTADNEHYLYHDIFGNANVNGALFMDFRNAPDFSNPNTIIYGHNMRNGTMFHDLRHFMQRDFFARHPFIFIVAEHEVLVYEIFSAFSTAIDFDYIQVFFNHPQEFANLLDEITSRRVYNTGISVNRYDNILILSTCTNAREDTRFVVAGRLAKRIGR